MMTELPKCHAEVKFQIPSSTNFGEKRGISLDGNCSDIAKIIQDNLVGETQVLSVKGKASIQVKDKKIEQYTVASHSDKILESKEVAKVFAKFEGYSKSNLLSRFCKSRLMQVSWRKAIKVTRENDTVLK